MYVIDVQQFRIRWFLPVAAEDVGDHGPYFFQNKVHYVRSGVDKLRRFPIFMISKPVYKKCNMQKYDLNFVCYQMIMWTQ